MPRKRKPRNVAKARDLRKSMSLPEVLWQHLRRSPHGTSFRRQHPVGDFVLDFYCASAKLAIEIDGIAHDMGDRPNRDADRDLWLFAQGITTLRIPVADVLKSVADVADGIVRLCLERR